jgi:hypothetical protein
MTPRTQSILLSGAAIAVIATLVGLLQQPILVFCASCLVVLGGGLLATWHYTGTNNVTITPGQGAGMGALTGVTAALISVALGAILTAAGILPEPAEAMQRAFEQQGGAGLSPEQEDAVLNFVRSPFYYVLVALFSAMIYAIGGAIGGAIGANLFRRGDSPQTEPERF